MSGGVTSVQVENCCGNERVCTAIWRRIKSKNACIDLETSTKTSVPIFDFPMLAGMIPTMLGSFLRSKQTLMKFNLNQLSLWP